MMRSKMLIIVPALLAASCGQNPSNTSENENVSINAAAPANDVDNAQEAAQPQAFDIASVPVSDTSLGDFPFISLPEGYVWEREETRDFDHFMFWTGAALKDVEGRLFMGRVGPEKSNTHSAYELRRNLDAVIAQAGGVLITDSRIPKEIIKTLSDDMTSDKYLGLGDIYNDKTTTWAIRRADREIWVHATPTGNRLAMVIIETKPFVATARLLPASALKEAIDKHGKAVVEVNFATDASDILPTSQPQIDAIATLLRQQSALRLAVNGHTDDTGSAERNLMLSEARAASVRAALIGAGIAGDRLTAKGFGSSAPVASNDTPEGKAQNRRVELARL